jgi:hypothetical protein
MRFSLRKTGVALTAGAVIVCCSCERHRVGELPTQESEVKAPEGKSDKRGGHQKGESPKSATHAASSPNESQAVPKSSPVSSPTPANFFPEQSPH